MEKLRKQLSLVNTPPCDFGGKSAASYWAGYDENEPPTVLADPSAPAPPPRGMAQGVQSSNISADSLPSQGQNPGAANNVQQAPLKRNVAASMSLSEVLDSEFPPKNPILSPVLREMDLVEIFAKRGVGKTLFALQLAINVAAGVNFLGWESTGPRRVTYIDGEMPGALLQERAALAVRCAGGDTKAALENLVLVSPDFQEDAMPNLASPAGQAWIEPLVASADVIFLDSLLTLSDTGDLNKAESFTSMERYLLRLRKRGKTVVFLHHSGKTGDQLGSIRKETTLDTCIGLTPVSQEDAAAISELNGCQTVAKLEFTKSRSLYGSDAMPLLIGLGEDGWHCVAAEDFIVQQIVEMSENGESQISIANQLGISQSKVSRTLSKHGLGKKR